MNLQKKLTENLTLHYVEANNWSYDDDGNEITDMYELSFSFYDKNYTAYVASERLDEEYATYASIEGDGELFDSFEDLMKNKYWKEVVEQCKSFEIWKEEL